MGIAFGTTPLAVRRGGSIPIIPAFEEILGIKTILMGFGLEQNAIHSPNESFPLDYFYKGIETVAEFYREGSV
jgi:acetylornithine deacetylase/succinyl-diaminopimelate desuccinylase-like protein